MNPRQGGCDDFDESDAPNWRGTLSRNVFLENMVVYFLFFVLRYIC
jgi:hypothetical protein